MEIINMNEIKLNTEYTYSQICEIVGWKFIQVVMARKHKSKR